MPGQMNILPSGCLRLIAYLSYVVFEILLIVFLVRDRHVCENLSPLWIYALVSTIISTLVVCTYPSEDDALNLEKGPFIFSVFFSIINVISGGIVIYGGDICDDMKNTGLYLMALLTFYASIAVILTSLFFKFSAFLREN